MRKINVYCGETENNRCSIGTHPVTQFNEAKRCIDVALLGNENDTPMSLFSNSPDFVSTIFYLAEDRKIPAEFFLNGESCGNDIETIFSDFNKFYDLLDENVVDKNSISNNNDLF